MTGYMYNESDGSATLGEALQIGIYDYQRHFGREPKLIVAPWWRASEIPAKAFDYSGQMWKESFRGIPFRWSIICDAIELSGSLDE